jgi:ABC-type sugar transport system ATPase subunit
MISAERTLRSGDAEQSISPSPVLEVRGLSKQFPGVLALDDVSLALHAGQVHALVGQNGAGKSTLINILSGMYGADRGTVAVDGRPVHIGNTRHALSLGIATVYQELSLLLNLTIAQNLALGREPRRVGLLDTKAMRDDSVRALARLGLDLDPDAMVGRLSLAQRQMVEIAKALSTEPKILILDEPTAPLGAREAEQLFDAIRSLRAQGVSVLYVSHRFAEVLSLCDIATILRNGRHVVTTDLEGWSEARLTDAMIGGRSQRYEKSMRVSGERLLRVTGLGWRQHVRDVAFEVFRGEIVALTGLLGGGQNEIARLVGGDLAFDTGVLEMGGVERRFVSPHAAVQASVCLVTEDRKHEGILPNRPLCENIAVASLPARIRLAGVVDGAAERLAVADAASNFGVVASSPDVPMRTLSGGNQQKALLARWHLADADIFVLIEPTRGVDVGARAEIYRRLDTLAKAGKAIIIVSSELPEVLAVADRILVVREGKISAETSPERVDEEELNLLVQGVQSIS